MRSSIVSKIILKTQRPSMLVAAIVGCLVGFFLVITSIQVYYNFNHILSDKDQAIGSQFLVLNKSVSVINTMGNKKSVFSSQEIDALKSQPFVERISPFLPNQFSAMAWLQFSVGDGNNVELKTDLFMESVDDGFIDVKSEDWKWEPGNDIIPVILPTDFINLYNFTYAPARGLPQLSKSTVSLFSFKIILGEGASQKILKGKIIGFSNRINSMVVPGSFMKYANANFISRPSEAVDYYRLIVEVKPQKLVQFQEYINTMGYETNEELLKSGKFASLLQAILAVVLLLGIIMIVNAFFGFLLYLQLIISRSKYELETLLRLGYRHKKLTQWYSNSIGFILFLVAAVAFFILFIVQRQVSGFVSTYGFEFPATVSKVVMLTGTILIILLYLIFYVSVRKQIYRLSLPK